MDLKPDAFRSSGSKASRARDLSDLLRDRSEFVRIASRVVRDPSSAEEVVDEAYARLVAELDRGSAVDNLAAWLTRTALRLAVDLVRRRARRQRPGWQRDAALSRSRALDPTDEVERRELRERVWAELLSLPDRQRDVLILRQMEGLAYQEIAALLDLNEATARVHAHAGREALRKKLGDWSERGE